MTIKQTLQTIKSFGMSARWIAETKEYRVSRIGCRQHSHCFLKCEVNETVAYYTEDSDDAIKTAEAMAIVDRTKND